MRILLLFLFSISCGAQEYFPEGEFLDQKEEWYSSFLKALGEEPLCAVGPSKGHESYRFLWLRSFDRPTVFRVEVRNDGTGVFFIKVTDGKGGYEPGNLVRDESREISKMTVESLTFRFMAERFFEIPTTIEENIGTDGSTWILEACVDGDHHVVVRWTPGEGTVRRTGMELIEFAIGGDFVPIY